MTQKASTSSCLVIGGGISGLIAATVLRDRNMQVTVVDKGRAIGGRMATRRIRNSQYGEGIFDYGAQYFTAQDPKFQALVNSWIQEGIVKEWSLNQQILSRKVYYRGVNSNRSIAQHLAENLDVHTNIKAISFAWQDDHWQVLTANNETFLADVLILTPPLPQTLELLDRSQIQLPPETRHRLEEIVYHPCIALLALLAQPSQIPSPGGMHLDRTLLSWIACNQKKGISPQGNAVTLHATSEFSKIHWDIDNTVIANQLLEAASPWLCSSVIDYQVHRWRYSQPQTVYGEPYLVVTKPGPIVICGDAFIQPDVEGAVLSGLAAAEYLLG
ncbi:NAD(P)/FAD-dependent oxidoreductase [Fischerella thermalis]|uniref:NAD(P)/FAD-dependent oxidoreductase n=1 Tax=Fischerella thermalis TaxID=372787 RepID=UPI0019E2CB16|nr:FAD-dependent oxidoreductase [Fischerella thermalis]MBF1990716.1 FAD-dependent oxidoreductase [Fischerella thermalis M58_A2018_009]MBF2061105.1 FAD-dependent oxidoreductase [Fischerella thermalis M66_A2018_004]MBF2071381.1 FAD-dependent oxidoreductase [Fischerella thermalis M48_A2018_028]